MSALITKREKQKRGFTMIELLAVLVILGIIMVIAVPSVVSYLQSARSDYYDQLEESVKTVGQEYFSDHRSLMPRENGQIFSVDIQDLITEGYTTEILDSDGNDTCTGNVYVKRLATADFEYHACIQCGKTDAEGNQEYISTSAFCTGGTTGNNPDGECDKVKDDPTDDCFMIRIPNSFKVPQCTTVEDSAASQGISLEGIVLNNGEDIGDRVTADTTSVDYKNIGNYKVYYTYKQVLNPAGEKYNFGVTIYDDKAPSDVTITMHTDSESGDVYNCPTRENCSWTGKDVYITFTATDKSDCGTEGSGVKQFMYRYGSSGNWQSVGATETTINGEIAYTATVVRKTTFDGIIDVKTVDNAQVSGTSSNHESGTTRAYLLVDKTPPSCTSSGGSSDWINKSSNPGTITITGTCSDTNSGCREEKITKEYSTDIDSTTESPGTVYDNVGNSTVCPGNRTVKIDKTDPTCTSSGGSTNWTAGTITLTGTCNDNLSGCRSNVTKQYTQQINSTTESPGTIYDNAGNSGTCPGNQTVRIDKTAPTCTSSGGTTQPVFGKVTLVGTCHDNESGCQGNVTKEFSGKQNLTNQSPGSVCDNVGHCTACPANQNVQINANFSVVGGDACSNGIGSNITWSNSGNTANGGGSGGCGSVRMLTNWGGSGSVYYGSSPIPTNGATKIIIDGHGWQKHYDGIDICVNDDSQCRSASGNNPNDTPDHTWHYEWNISGSTVTVHFRGWNQNDGSAEAYITSIRLEG